MPKAFTVCFCGTGCARDEGEATRFSSAKPKTDAKPISDHRIYDPLTGYIPVRLHLEISGSANLRAVTDDSVTVRGVGENDWYDSYASSEPLRFDKLKVPSDLASYVKGYGDGSNQRSDVTALTGFDVKRLKGLDVGQLTGFSAAALALHAANVAAASGAERYNFVGHSRGAVASIMAAWFLYAYGGPYSGVEVRIFAIDPVPGPGHWYGILTQLPPNVVEYVGVYAWDHLDGGFHAVVPRPNGLRMTLDKRDIGKESQAASKKSSSNWKEIADDCQLHDPLSPDADKLGPPNGYKLYMCRGRHSTIAGNATKDGLYDASHVHDDVRPLPRLIYKIARAYLTEWDTVFRVRCAVGESARELRRKIHTNHDEFDAMGGGAGRRSRFKQGQYLREISSTAGRDPTAKSQLENVVGSPPYQLVYPCTPEKKTGDGWVKWKFL